MSNVVYKWEKHVPFPRLYKTQINSDNSRAVLPSLGEVQTNKFNVNRTPLLSVQLILQGHVRYINQRGKRAGKGFFRTGGLRPDQLRVSLLHNYSVIKTLFNSDWWTTLAKKPIWELQLTMRYTKSVRKHIHNVSFASLSPFTFSPQWTMKTLLHHPGAWTGPVMEFWEVLFFPFFFALFLTTIKTSQNT